MSLIPLPRPGMPSGEPQPRPAAFRRGVRALHHANYRRYWFGQLGSLVGAWMQSVAQPWLVLELGGSPLQLGIVLALMFAPAMVLAPIGGVFADRIDKRRALMVLNSLGMLQAATLFTLTFTGLVQIPHLYVLALFAGFINALEMPIRHALPAEMVPPEDLPNAIALNSTAFNLSRVVGPAVAGVTIALFGVAVSFGINALSYVFVLVGLWRIEPRRMRQVRRPDVQLSVRQSLVEGLRYAAATPLVLWPLVLLGGVAAFAMNFQTLLPVFSRDTLAMDAGGYGAMFAVMGAGSLAGSLMLAFVVGQRPVLRFILGGAGAFLLLEAILSLVRVPAVAFMLVAGIGFASMLMVNTINVTIQNNVPDALRGRVMSLFVTVFAGTVPLGGLFAGAVAGAFGAPAALLAGALIAASVLALVTWRLWPIAAARRARARRLAAERDAVQPGDIAAA